MIFFFMVLFTIFILGGLLYLLYIPFKIWLVRTERLSFEKSRRINKIYFGILTAIVLAITYIGIFPDESFYADEFKRVTLRKLPDSADFISKSASYPDFHGEYWSRSEIELSRPEYNKLLMELYKDERFNKNFQRLSFEGGKNTKDITYQFLREIEEESDLYLYIGFSKNKKTIYVDLSRS